jgi:hypothetical protein
MVGITVKVSDGTDRFEVAVRARSIERALRIVAKRYPGSHIDVRFPIEPEGFFVESLTAEGLLEDKHERRAA